MARVTTRPKPVRARDQSTSPGEELVGETCPASDQHASDEPAALVDEPKLTVAAVARRLGVAPATLRTWDRRYGLGPSEHASGSHRRYGAEDIARLEQMQRALLRGASPAEAARYALSATLPSTRSVAAPDDQETRTRHHGWHEPLLLSGVLDSSECEEVEFESANTGGRGLKLTGEGPRARGLGRAALALDSSAAQRLLIESINSAGVVETWLKVVSPVMRAVQEWRQCGGSGAEVRQLLADSAETALRWAIGNASVPLNPRPVLLAPVPGEEQELELVALAAALAGRRVGHRLFGSAVPKEGLDAAIRRAAPAAVVLWAERSHYATPELIDALPNTRQRVRVFAAGPGWVSETLPEQSEVLHSWESAVARISETMLT